MKILIVTQYFWPENFRINDLAKSMIDKGHEVTILTGMPNYPDGFILPEYQRNPNDYAHFHGAKIIRVPMITRGQNSAIKLALNYLSYFISASYIALTKLRKQKFDVIFAHGTSPIFQAIPAVILGRYQKTPVYIWVLDLWPESLRAVGVVKNKYLLAGVGKAVTWLYNRIDTILIQSRSFAKNIQKYNTKPSEVIYFPNWAEDIFTTDQATSSLITTDPQQFTITFAGNIGDAQDFPTILNAAELLKDNAAIRWVIVGDGRASKWLTEEVAKRQLNNVLLLGRHPLSEMPALFKASDALLVALKTEDIFSMTIPGKVQSYMAAKKPIIGMIDGEAAAIITEAQCGYASSAGDASALAENILKMATSSATSLQIMGENGHRYYMEHFNKENLMNELEALFKRH